MSAGIVGLLAGGCNHPSHCLPLRLVHSTALMRPLPQAEVIQRDESWRVLLKRLRARCRCGQTREGACSKIT